MILYYLVLNVSIIVLIAIGIVVTGNPLFLLGLLLLANMPIFESQMPQNDDEEEESQPMGFTAKM